jgi:hypothetical protein
MKQTDEIIISSVQHWFEQAVLGLNLCPFAHKPHKEGSIRFELSHAADDESCLADIYRNLLKLDEYPKIETLVIICANHLADFDDYNQFLNLTDQLLEQQGWEGEYQIASFHPDYCFEGCDRGDRANWTNRSPYPLFHLIREQSISRARETHPDVKGIPQTNIETLDKLSAAEMNRVFKKI